MQTIQFDPDSSLAAAISEPWKRTGLPTVMIPLDASNNPVIPNRTNIVVLGNEASLKWQAPPIPTLFRGSVVPPSLETYPREYVLLFAHIESQVWRFCDSHRVGRDEELRELFAELRRRPEGKSRSVLHTVLWQILALTLAAIPLSQAQYEAIVQRMSQSARSFSMGPSSRNYLQFLAGMFGR